MSKKIVLVWIVFLIAILSILYFFGFNSKERYMTTDFDLEQTDTKGEFYVVSIWDMVEEKSCRYVVIKPLYITDQFHKMKITEIGEDAFVNLTIMERVYIPLTIKKIDKNAFSGCTNLKQIDFQGNEKEWEKIVIESGNDVLKNVTIHYDVAIPNID